MVIFLGAGASKAFGFPTMTEFVDNFKKHLTINRMFDELTIFTEIHDVLKKRSDKPLNLERVFTVIESLSSGFDVNEWRDEEYFIIKRPNKGVSIKTLVNVEINTIKNLKQEFHKLVKDTYYVGNPEVDQDILVPVLGKLLNKIQNMQGVSAGNFTIDGTQHSIPILPIFTTNYDDVVEVFCKKVKLIKKLDVGADTEDDGNTVLKHDKLAEYNTFCLRKLHGSVTFYKLGNRVVVYQPQARDIGYETHEGEMLILPVNEKNIYKFPFFQAFYAFDRALQADNNDIWYFIGFNFDDEFIQQKIIDNINENKRIVIFNPNAKQIIKDKFSDYEHLILPFPRKLQFETLDKDMGDFVTAVANHVGK